MGLHTDLDAYKTGYELLKKTMPIVQNMEKQFKEVMGKDIAKETGRLLRLVYRANVAADKVPHLAQLQEHVKYVEMLLQLSLDMGKISPRQFFGLTKLTESLGKQTTAWKNSSLKRPPHGGQGRHV
ncbi:four helix bundle protein [Burkholderia sp. IDO3]|uniref:four helix bundle protein n=1 Tax=Burkholderia sp. IDO3 TaxID=1705310 RepID=UPI000BBAE78E|nr:four helix bundle protein [Burkholderia sp. IDO3]AXK61502.1 four helix bundle protein [Burkholderia sp. IDO3]PCD58200.1 four helix bundle protein [Burkholderia sp. IDO3]